ncbi:MAG: SUMF1/EgtB/PvdO family nonheme iron enzyme [Cyanobacteria bacterium P01_F01_bin.53]
MARAQSIFISYRRSDTIGHTGRMYDRLVAEFGRENVFKDVDDIPLGVDFAEHLDKAVGQCQVVLVVIGKTWTTVVDEDGNRRLDNQDDFVRIEVESALKRGIPVIPVLLEGVSMPNRAQLPKSLHPLVRRNGTQVGYDPRFHTDMDRLIKGLQALMRVAESVPGPGDKPESESAVTQEADATTRPVAKAVKEALTEDIPVAPAKPSVPTFPFEVVKVDAKGNETQREQRSAEYRREDLGQGVTLDMVAIPGGSFQMGSADGQGDANERPQHKVTVQPFLMGKCSVTQAQWKAVAALPEVERGLEAEPSAFSGQNRPVEQVDWDAAVEFCQRLSRKTGRDYRLPSEAEWEYACRAGTSSAFHYGETLTAEVANYRASSTFGSGPKGEYRRETTDVGSFPANGFGLSDMHGNVWEWCQDHWHDNYEGAPTDGSAWLSSDENARRLLRGGSWGIVPGNCRSAYRLRLARDFRINSIGFRVVCGASWTL